ncbi:MAG: hypothetical protein NVS1B7_6380 [Candidatus Saccharimonadales bacterium]
MNVSDLAKLNNIEPNKAYLYKIGAFFIFPLAIALGAGSAFLLSFLALAIELVVWILLLKIVYRKVGLNEPSKIIGVTVGTGVAFFTGEFIGGAALVLYGAGGISESSGGGGTGAIIYLALAAVLPFVIVPLMRKMTKPLLIQGAAVTPIGQENSSQRNETVVYPESQTPHTMDNAGNYNSDTPEQPQKPQE